MRSMLTLLTTAAAIIAAPSTGDAQAGLAHQVDALVAPYRTMGLFDGTILVARGDRILFRKGYGLANQEHQVPMPHDAVFRVASVAKGITDLAAGRLIKQGKLSAGDKLSRFLPDFPMADSITIRHILTGRSGIVHINNLPWYEEASRFHHELPDLVARIQSHPLSFAPGTRAAYSNGAYAVLARVIELVSGQSFPAFVRDEVFIPLGMRHSAIETRDTVVAGRALGYSVDVAGFAPAPYFEPSIKIGGGTLLTNAEDLFRWIRQMYSTDFLPPDIRDDVFAALTYETSPAGRPRIYAGGFQPGYNSSVQYYPAEDITVVVLSNIYSRVTEDLSDGIVKLMLGQAVQPQRVFQHRSVAAEQLDRIAGAYLFGNALPNRPVVFQRVGERLAVVDSIRGSRIPLIAESPTTFIDPLVLRRYRFTIGADGRATGGEWEWIDVHITPRRAPVPFTRAPATAP